MQHRRAVDRNQKEIVDALRAAGASVEILSAVGKGCPDLLVGHRGRNWLIEVKDGEKRACDRPLTEAQVAWHAAWRGQKAIALTVDEALAVLGIRTAR